MSGNCSFSKQNSTGKRSVVDDHQYGRRQRTPRCTKTCDFGLSKRLELSLPVRYLKHLRGKVAEAVVRMRTTTTTAAAAASKSSSHRVHINNHDPIPKEIRAKTSVAPVDSQRAEAIHDCIDFINSSASLPRSNSVALARQTNYN